MTQAEHIHTPSDGRGRRRVLVDGQEVKRCTFADTMNGIVRFDLDPLRWEVPGEKFMQGEKRGRVEIVPL